LIIFYSSATVHTYPEAGGCIAQAILERILQSESSRTVSTTHPSVLKALSLADERFSAASVLLHAGDSNMYKRPTFVLSYNTIGDSYALGAATRLSPSLPDDVLERAASLIASNQDEHGTHIRVITEALQKEKENAYVATTLADEYKNDMKRCRDAMILLAKAYDQDFSRLEARLDAIFTELNDDETKNAYDLVGNSLSSLRLMKKRIKSQEEILKEKGLRVVTEIDIFRGGENVIIINDGALVEGESATVSRNQENAKVDELIIVLDWSSSMISIDEELDYNNDMIQKEMIMKRRELAVWDYPDEDDWRVSFNNESHMVKSVLDSRNRLYETLNSLKSTTTTKATSSSTKRSDEGNNQGTKHMSSRERKAASNKKKKAQKKGRK